MPAPSQEQYLTRVEPIPLTVTQDKSGTLPGASLGSFTSLKGLHMEPHLTREAQRLLEERTKELWCRT